MARKTRTKTEREQALLEVARLDRRGCSQREIAAALGVSHKQVWYDLERIRERYREATHHERHAKVEEKRAQLREARWEAWQAWERSKEDARKVVEEEPTGAEGGRGKRVTTVEGRLPDPAYLRAVLETLRDESALLGLDAPKQVDARVSLNWDELWKRAEDGEFDGVEKELAEHEAHLRARADAPPGEGGGTT
jgi:predicted DNA-binding protein (UPF0251 family)